MTHIKYRHTEQNASNVFIEELLYKDKTLLLRVGETEKGLAVVIVGFEESSLMAEKDDEKVPVTIVDTLDSISEEDLKAIEAIVDEKFRPFYRHHW